jgi:hypothetical protein
VSLTEFETLFRALTTQEQARFALLSSTASDTLRQEAINRGVNLDALISEGRVLPQVIKQVATDIIARVLVQPTDLASSGTLATSTEIYAAAPTPTMKVWTSELARLGLLNQRVIRQSGVRKETAESGV